MEVIERNFEREIGLADSDFFLECFHVFDMQGMVLEVVGNL